MVLNAQCVVLLAHPKNTIFSSPSIRCSQNSIKDYAFHHFRHFCHPKPSKEYGFEWENDDRDEVT